MIYYNNKSVKKLYNGTDLVTKMNKTVGGSRLPDGYTEVTYIRQSADVRQSRTNAWTVPITNMVSGDSLTVVFWMDSSQRNVSRYISIFGSDEVFAIRQDSGYGYCLNTGYFDKRNYQRGNYTMEYDTKLSFNYKPSLLTVTNVSTGVQTLVNLNQSGGFNPSLNFGVFGFWYGGTGEYLMKGNIFEILVEGSDNSVKYHYVPCKRNSDNKVGLYDIVNNVFSSPSGFTITAGQEVTPAIDKAIFQYVTDDAAPYDAEIEYLESDGASYINTGIYLNTSNFEIGYEQVGVGTEKHWGYVHQNVANGAWVSVMHDVACFGKITNNVNISSYLTSGNNTIKYTQTGITVNNTTKSKNLNLSGVDNLSTVPVPIFSWYDFYSRGMEYSENYPLKSFYIKNNGVLVLDMIPVRVGQVGYMYDKVSGQLFGNDGTGAFILGQDK